ncbi:MAG: stage III sporulation protein AD [Oscillospiraceae bacterium]|nr:stage III sporulation protein AD [Oscillospiraceae bacterium]
MSDIIKVAAAAAAAAVCAVVVRRQAPELGLVLAACAGAVIVLYCSEALRATVELMDKLVETGGLSAQVVEPVMKTAGIAIVTRLSADFCRDAKEGGLASAVELAGTALALAAVLPLMSAVVEMLTGLI